jgi:hypothetical protein
MILVTEIQKLNFSWGNCFVEYKRTWWLSVRFHLAFSFTMIINESLNLEYIKCYMKINYKQHYKLCIKYCLCINSYWHCGYFEDISPKSGKISRYVLCLCSRFFPEEKLWIIIITIIIVIMILLLLLLLLLTIIIIIIIIHK